jgi:hypothetical protein
MIFQNINTAFRVTVIIFLFGASTSRAQDTTKASYHAWWNETSRRVFRQAMQGKK